MRPSFHPRLVNGPFEDPVLFIPFIFENRAVLFDLGEIYALSPRDILKISHVFITHTHMDHFVGFDRLIRLLLGREKTLYLYGPEGFLKNVEGKLAAYSWNLVQNYTNRFILNATEVQPDRQITKQYLCRQKFSDDGETIAKPFERALLEEPALTVSALVVDHSLPSLGFCINERFHVNILKDRVLSLGLEIGPWLKKFKQALFSDQNPDSPFTVAYGENEKTEKTFTLEKLTRQVAMITPGQKVVYIADVVYNQTNLEKIVAFAGQADHLFIEAAFSDRHREIARQKYHLTAGQAGTIAGLARVKQFTIFHFSPRYIGEEHLLYQEAQEAFEASFGETPSDLECKQKGCC